MSAILREEPSDLAETNKNISPELERIVRRCLEKDPGQRYPSAGEVVRYLAEASEQLGTKPVAPMSAAGVFLHRHRAGVAAAALLVAIAVAAGWWWKTRGGPGAVGTRLAVLPFENLTGDPEQAYLADGIHESLITDLARLSGFSRVIARPSVMSYAKTTKRLAEIGKELGVDALVTGSVMRAAAKLKVTAHLIKAGSEEHVWSESYEREPRDILSLQNEIVRAIAQTAKLALTPAEQKRLAAARPVSPEAYEAYLKGKFQLNKMTPDGFEKALAYLNQAAEMDPTSPLPQSALALAYARMGHERFPDFFARSREAAAKAQRLGGEPLAEMYQALGMTKLYSDWDREGAAKDFRRAMELNPSLGDPHRDYSWYLHLVGRRPEALAEMKRAQELEPLTPLFFADRGWQLWWGEKTTRRWQKPGSPSIWIRSSPTDVPSSDTFSRRKGSSTRRLRSTGRRARTMPIGGGALLGRMPRRGEKTRHGRRWRSSSGRNPKPPVIGRGGSSRRRMRLLERTTRPSAGSRSATAAF